MGFNTGKKVQEAGIILGGLGVIGFIGVVWLMIYGNLSGNLGFTPDSSSFVNQTINLNDTGSIPAGATNRVDGSISAASVIMTNATTDATVLTVATNYTLSGIRFFSVESSNNETDVNVSYTVSYDGPGEANTEGVIANVTGGFGTFFGFSNTFFTIAAIVLLIFMLVGLLALVVMIVRMQTGGKKSGGFR